MGQKNAEKFEVLSLEISQGVSIYFMFLVLESSLGSVWTGDLSIAVDHWLLAAENCLRHLVMHC